MLIRVPIGKDNPAIPYRSGHKPLALLYSVALHAGIVALLFLPVSFSFESETPYHSVVVQLEKDHKLIYYDFRKELPEVSASNPTGKRTTPSPDAPKSKQRIVAAPKEKPGKQLVYLPEPRIQLKSDLTAPNLIAIETPAEIPLPDRPKPKPFQAPETPKSLLPPVAPLPNAPELAAKPNSKDPALSKLLDKPSGPVKSFTAPPVKTVAPAAPAALPNAPAVAASAGDNNSAIASLLNKPVGPAPKKFTPPALPAAAAKSTPAPLPNAPAIDGGVSEKNSSVAALLNKPSGPVRQFAPRQAPGASAAAGLAPASLPNAPAIADGASEKNSAVAALLNTSGGPVRQFTPPPARGANGPAAAPAALPGAPEVGSTPSGQDPAIAALLNKPGAPPPKPFTAPRSANGTAGSAAPAALPAAPAVNSGGQPASATVAILGLNPANVPQIPRPEGSRPARIEAGTPDPGATHAELGGGNSSISVPDISIQGSAPASPATATRAPLDRSTPPATGLARPQAPKILATTPHVSSPQWPNNRRLPVAVEHHFQNRVVYITLIPADQSGDDWVVWYADSALVPTDPNLVMYPPMLLKASSLPPFPAHNDHGIGSVRITGVIGKDGHFGALTDLAGAPADRELAEALQSWQFGPARRNGVIIDADAVIEIPVMFGKLSLR